MSSSVLETLSNEFAAAAEAVGGSVVAIYGRRWMPSSGIQWRKGVIVTANHTIRRQEDITVSAAGGQSSKATLAGRDPSTDLAILKVGEDTVLPVPQVAEEVKLGHFVLALGRSRGANLVASAHIRLDLELYPGFSGGPLVNAQGKVVGINTRGLARGRGVTIPIATVNRVVDELLKTGHIAQPYLGLAMQPVAVPQSLRAKVSSATNSALLVVHVETSSPAEKSGIQLGDLVVEFQGKPVEDTVDLQDLLSSAKVTDTVGVTLLRGGAPLTLSVKLEDRPTR